jgi:hypothetical protein
MTWQASRLFLVAILSSFSVLPSFAKTTPGLPDRPLAEPPSALMECDGDQCRPRNGGGGSIWLFEGAHGKALWRYGAVADLTIEQFDGKTIEIRREDPPGTYSGQYARNGIFTAVYTGTIKGDHIYGSVIWNGNRNNPGRWYATIPDGLCDWFDECPLDANEVLRLGERAVESKLYSSALLCFLISARQGIAEAQTYAGAMLHKGIGAPQNDKWAFDLLQQSAEQGDYNGEVALGQMYANGWGTNKNPEQASAWLKRADMIRSQRAQQQREQVMAVGALAGMAYLLWQGSRQQNSDDSAGSGASDFDRMMIAARKKLMQRMGEMAGDYVADTLKQGLTQSH